MGSKRHARCTISSARRGGSPAAQLARTEAANQRNARFGRKVSARRSRLPGSSSWRTQNAQAVTARGGDTQSGSHTMCRRRRGARHAVDCRPALQRQLELRNGSDRRFRSVGAAGALTAARRRIVGLLFFAAARLGLVSCRGAMQRMASADHHIIAATGGRARWRECRQSQQHDRCRSAGIGGFSSDVKRHSSTDRKTTANRSNAVGDDTPANMPAASRPLADYSWVGCVKLAQLPGVSSQAAFSAGDTPSKRKTLSCERRHTAAWACSTLPTSAVPSEKTRPWARCPTRPSRRRPSPARTPPTPEYRCTRKGRSVGRFLGSAGTVSRRQ